MDDKKAAKGKGKKDDVVEEQDSIVEPPEEIPHFSEDMILREKLYSDATEKLTSLGAIC